MTTEPLPVADVRGVRHALAALIRRDRRNFALVVGLSMLTAIAGAVGPWLLGRIVDAVRNGEPVRVVDRYAAGVALVAVVRFVLVRYAAMAGSRFGERTQAHVRETYLDRVLALPPAVVERAGTGDLTARGTNDAALVGQILSEAAPTVVIAALQALVLIGAVFFVDPMLGVCAVPGVTVMVVIGRWYVRRARAAYLVAAAAGSGLVEQLTASVGGARTIEALGLGTRRREACVEAIAASRTAQERTLRLRSVLYPVLDVASAIPVVLTVALGGHLVREGRLSVGAVVSAALYFRQLEEPVDSVLRWIDPVQSAAASFARIEGVGRASSEPLRPDTDRVPAHDRVEAADASFAYDGRGDVVSAVTLSVRPGERLAIVGASGAGKTTLARLLAGTERPRSGSVTVGGVPVADLVPEELHRHILFVTQEQHLFLGTIRENLTLGAPHATDAELTRALGVVGATWFDDLSDGLDTALGVGRRVGQVGVGGRVGERESGGVQLDDAQAQQLALARVVLADPHTVILDEATSLLESGAARRTERALAAVLEGRTIIAVAHRLHTARDADRVAIMDAGRIVEIGSHDELLARGGAYARLWLAWNRA